MNNQMRETAKKRDWEGCKEALHYTLMHTEKHRAANVCLEYFTMYLPRFLDIAGSGNWLSIRLEDIQESKLFSEKGNDLPPFPDMNLKYAEPKLRTTKWALFYFWSGARWHSDNRLSASKLTEAIASMITVLRREHPDWLPAQYDVEDVRLLDSQEYGEFLWTKLADTLESA